MKGLGEGEHARLNWIWLLEHPLLKSLKVGKHEIQQMLEDIRAYGRQERARGLRAAARQARKDAEGWEAHSVRDAKRGWNESSLRCSRRADALRSISRWCDRRARAIEKGRDSGTK